MVHAIEMNTLNNENDHEDSDAETMEVTGRHIPRGKPKSGRVWKTEKNRFKSIVKDKPLKTSWALKMKQKQEQKLIKSREAELKEAKQKEISERKRRRAERLQKKKENERKAEIVQKISNTAKIKRMSKKQLKSIRKQ